MTRLFAALLVAAGFSIPSFGQGTATATGSGNWSDSSIWNTTPGGFAPNNGTGSAAWTATIGSGTVTLDTAIVVQQFNFNGGILNGSNSLTVNGATTWAGMYQGTGTINLNGGVNFVANGTAEINGASTVNVSGGATLTGTGNFNLYNGGTLNNLSGSLFDVQNDGSITNLGAGAAPSFSNAGTFRKSGGTGTSTVSVPFTNTGTVEGKSGTLNFTGGGSASGNALYAIDAGMTVGFTDGTTIFSGNAGSTGAGTFRIANASTTLTFNGTHTLASAVSFDQVSTVNGAGTVTVTGPASWSGSTYQGTGSLNFNGGLTLDAASSPEVNGTGTVNIGVGGAVITGDGVFSVYNGGTVNVLAGATFDIQSDATISNFGGGLDPLLSNAGTLQKSAGTGTSFIALPFTNTGTVTVSSGTLLISSSSNFSNYDGGTQTLTGGTYRVLSGATLDLDGRAVAVIAPGTTVELNGAGSIFAALDSLTQVNGTLRVFGGKVFAPTNPITVGGTLVVGGAPGDTGSSVNQAVTVAANGVLRGHGSVTGPVVVNTAGRVAPGSSPGILTLGNGVTFQPGSNLDIAINGTGLGSQYSQLAVTGNAALSGNLNVTLGGGFTPSNTDTFTVVNATSRSGTFDNTPGNLLTLSGVGTFNVTYGAGSVTLGGFQPAPVPEPATLLGMAAAVGLVGRVRRRGIQTVAGLFRSGERL
jgi:hypothetical protein